MDPTKEYCIIPLAGTPRLNLGSFAFQLTSYSSKTVELLSRPREYVDRKEAIQNLHQVLLNDERKLEFAVAPYAALACIQKRGCMYFVGINGSSDQILSLLLTVSQGKEIIFALGSNGDTHYVPPRSQNILLVLPPREGFPQRQN